jgi:hypothetical protein
MVRPLFVGSGISQRGVSTKNVAIFINVVLRAVVLLTQRGSIIFALNPAHNLLESHTLIPSFNSGELQYFLSGTQLPLVDTQLSDTQCPELKVQLAENVASIVHNPLYNVPFADVPFVDVPLVDTQLSDTQCSEFDGLPEVSNKTVHKSLYDVPIVDVSVCNDPYQTLPVNAGLKLPLFNVCSEGSRLVTQSVVSVEQSSMVREPCPAVPRIKAGYIPVTASMTEKLENWKIFLKNDFDSDYLLAGIEHGFHIVSPSVRPVSSACVNYKSALCENKLLSEEQIMVEINKDRYILCETKPHIISSLGAIIKPNGSVRLIHDFSRPDGGLNGVTTDTSVVYPTINDAVKLI